MLLLIKYSLLYATVLMLVALGGMFAERSGVVNLALEGIMTIGAIIGVLTLINMPADAQRFLLIALPALAAAFAGAVYAGLLAFAAINLKADQTIVGTALNMAAIAVAIIIAKAYNHSPSAKLSYNNAPFIIHLPIGGSNLTISFFLIAGLVLLVFAYVLLYKTRFGLRLMACGEHPQAAASVGVNVYLMRWTGVLLSGFLGGLGGLAYMIPTVQTWNFEVGVAGTGFLALAVLIFGQWRPQRIAGAALFFAVFRSLANIADSTILARLDLSDNIYRIMPFLASMIVLALTSKRTKAPKAEGIPYDKELR